MQSKRRCTSWQKGHAPPTRTAPARRGSRPPRQRRRSAGDVDVRPRMTRAGRSIAHASSGARRQAHAATPRPTSPRPADRPTRALDRRLERRMNYAARDGRSRSSPADRARRSAAPSASGGGSTRAARGRLRAAACAAYRAGSRSCVRRTRARRRCSDHLSRAKSQRGSSETSPRRLSRVRAAITRAATSSRSRAPRSSTDDDARSTARGGLTRAVAGTSAFYPNDVARSAARVGQVHGAARRAAGGGYQPGAGQLAERCRLGERDAFAGEMRISMRAGSTAVAGRHASPPPRPSAARVSGTSAVAAPSPCRRRRSSSGASKLPPSTREPPRSPPRRAAPRAPPAPRAARRTCARRDGGIDADARRLSAGGTPSPPRVDKGGVAVCVRHLALPLVVNCATRRGDRGGESARRTRRRRALAAPIGRGHA